MERSSGNVVATWSDPPSADTSGVWLPKLQEELDRIGLDDFRATYTAGDHGAAAPAASYAPEPEIDEDEIDRLWAREVPHKDPE